MLDMGELYLTGAEQRNSAVLPLKEWHSTKKAILLRLDPDTEKVTEKLEYVTPAEACTDNEPGIAFKAATLFENRLYVCTSTEVIIFEVPGFRQVAYLSLPCFNDLHHVRPTPSGTSDRKSTRLNSSHLVISYAVFCLKKKSSSTPTLP